MDKLVIFYILFKFFLMCLVLSFYSRQVELKKTCMGKFSPLTLAHRDWAQVTGFAPNNNFIFFNEIVVLRNCVCIGIILSRPGWYLTSSLICNTVRSYSYINQLNSILCGSIVIKFKLLVFPNQVLRISSLCPNDAIC